MAVRLIYLILVPFLLARIPVQAQQGPHPAVPRYDLPPPGKHTDNIGARTVVNGDTVLHYWLEPVLVTAKPVFKNRRERIRYTKLRRDVLKVLPYAKYAGAKYRQMEAELQYVDSEKERKEIIDAVEEDIKDNFRKDLSKLTIRQGTILIKLIDRETGRTSYVLLQELKSKLTAFMWQSIARIFGHNLKDHYNPEEEAEVEKVIRSVEGDYYYEMYYGRNYFQVQHRNQ